MRFEIKFLEYIDKWKIKRCYVWSSEDGQVAVYLGIQVTRHLRIQVPTCLKYLDMYLGMYLGIYLSRYKSLGVYVGT